jgi:hypothetical protein
MRAVLVALILAALAPAGGAGTGGAIGVEPAEDRL